jgi:hypothetical protein
MERKTHFGNAIRREEINKKLLTSLANYDPARGSAFSFVSRLALNMLAIIVTHRPKATIHFSRGNAKDISTLDTEQSQCWS